MKKINLRKKSSRDERAYARLVAQETLIFDVTEEISKALVAAGITRTELAESLGKSKGHVTQLLSGERNMTLRTAADLCFVLDRRLHVNARNIEGSLERPTQPKRCDAASEEGFFRLATGNVGLFHGALSFERYVHAAEVDPLDAIEDEDVEAAGRSYDHEFTLAA